MLRVKQKWVVSNSRGYFEWIPKLIYFLGNREISESKAQILMYAISDEFQKYLAEHLKPKFITPRGIR